jgi:hypothetical protein
VKLSRIEDLSMLQYHMSDIFATIRILDVHNGIVKTNPETGYLTLCLDTRVILRR